MGTLVTQAFRTHSAQQFVESFSDPANTIYFTAAHRSLPFVNDSIPPQPNTSVQSEYYNLYDNMIFAKNINPGDVVHMIKNEIWTTGTVYSMYDNEVSNLYLTNFFVVSPEGTNYHIFKCLNNNGGMPSTVQPLLSATSAADIFYQTSDGYQWKYMFSVTSVEYNKFATTDWIPLFANNLVTANSVSGTIETILVDNSGINYNAHATGSIKEAAVAGNNMLYSIESTSTLSSNSDFYKNSSFYIKSGAAAGQIRTILEYVVTGTERRVLLSSGFDANNIPNSTSQWEISPQVIIEGDGTSANAIAIINTVSNSVSSIAMINRGSGYTYANVSITGNTSIVTANTASARAIISPQGGHGSDIINELYASNIGISTTFNNNENNTIPDSNDYRIISIIKEPLFANVQLTTSISSSSFVAGEKITQSNTNAFGFISYRTGSVLRLTDIRGFFETGNSSINTITGLTSGSTASVSNVDRSMITVDETDHYQVVVTYPGPQGNGFILDEKVSQGKTKSSGYVFSFNSSGANSSVITLTNIKGSFALSDTVSGVINTFVGETSGAIATINGLDQTRNKFVKNSGEIIYIETMQPVNRHPSQSEKIKVIVQF